MALLGWATLALSLAFAQGFSAVGAGAQANETAGPDSRTEQPATGPGRPSAPAEQPPAAPSPLAAPVPPLQSLIPGIPVKPAYEADCKAWRGEPDPLPQVTDTDFVRARWAQLRVQDLRALGTALEERDRAGAHRVWKHVACLRPGDPKIQAAIARTLPVRVHRPVLAEVERRSQPVPVTLSVALARLSEEVQFLPEELGTAPARRRNPPPATRPPVQTPTDATAAVAPTRDSTPAAPRPSAPTRAPEARPSAPTAPRDAPSEPAPERLAPARAPATRVPPIERTEPTRALPERPADPAPAAAVRRAAPDSTPAPVPSAPPQTESDRSDEGSPTELPPPLPLPSAEPTLRRDPAPVPAPADPAPVPAPAAEPADPLELPDALPPAVSAGPSGPALDRARAALRAARFEDALRIAREARGQPSPASDRADLEFLAGTAAIALGRDQEALESFGRAIEADPERDLDPRATSPKVLRAYEAARATRANR